MGLEVHDVLIVGGGPAGLAAALTLGRARRRVIVCDVAEQRRNLAAVHLQNFVTRDGTPPAEFRRIAAGELARYRNVDLRAVRVDAIEGQAGAFSARLADGDRVTARRVVLCTGLVDTLPEVPGLRELWGTSVFQCPYCHGWEVQDQRFAYWASRPETVEFALLLRGWTRDVVVLTNGQFAVPDEIRTRLAAGGVGIDERPIAALDGDGPRLLGVVFTTGEPLARDALVMHPSQRQVALVAGLKPRTDERGYVQVDEAFRTSLPGVYAAGDLITDRHAAVIAAAAGMRAAAALNHELTIELALAGALD